VGVGWFGVISVVVALVMIVQTRPRCCLEEDETNFLSAIAPQALSVVVVA
jgi:hypothetical protein